MIENINKLYEDDDESNLENFENEENEEEENENNEKENSDLGSRLLSQDESLDHFENFDNDTMNINDYYKKSIPMYNEASIQHGERDELLKKLNYMIHLLEEQRNENTKHITEDLILYSFLGIFMIFVLDSFARVGKYVR